jgi:hypothetical protein
MKTELNELKNLWNQAKNADAIKPLDVTQLVQQAKSQKRATTRFHLGNILILTLVWVLLIYYFYVLFHFEDTISRVGHGLMVWGLGIRIAIEMLSTYFSTKIDLTENAKNVNNYTLKFFRFRKFIHGPVTYTIVGLYTLGFYMLTPEFSRYFNLPTLLLIDGSYVIGAIFLVWQIRKGIRKEMEDIRKILKFQEEMQEEK